MNAALLVRKHVPKWLSTRSYISYFCFEVVLTSDEESKRETIFFMNNVCKKIHISILFLRPTNICVTPVFPRLERFCACFNNTFASLLRIPEKRFFYSDTYSTRALLLLGTSGLTISNFSFFYRNKNFLG